jgi:hypothetical protein
MIGDVDSRNWQQASEYHLEWLENTSYRICKYLTKDGGKRFGLFFGKDSLMFGNKLSELQDLAEVHRDVQVDGGRIPGTLGEGDETSA